MDETCYSETSVDFQRTTRSYMPEDMILYNLRCENLKSWISKQFRFLLQGLVSDKNGKVNGAENCAKIDTC
jgi:hypothetical protein